MKKIMSVFMAVLLCAAIIGCGEKPQDNNSISSEVSGEVSQETESNISNSSDTSSEEVTSQKTNTSSKSTKEKTKKSKSSSYTSQNKSLLMGVFNVNCEDYSFKSTNSVVSSTDKKREAMLKSVLNNKDTVKAKSGGKTYYIAASGSDSNSGTSKNSPKATVSSIALKSGDCVLFKRGDTFRMNVTLVSGVSYGAYGSGNKPIISGSPTNAAKETWLTTTTKDVYSLRYKLSDVGSVIFNNGDRIGYLVTNKDRITNEDLSCFYDTGTQILYLYCKAGKPNEVFSSIEIASNGTGVKGTVNNVHIQNICVAYWSIHGIQIPNGSNNEIDGCVIGYIGGHGLYGNGGRLGNGIELWGNAINYKVHNNYVFQCYDAGMTHQWNGNSAGGVSEKDLYYTNNLLEYNVYNFEYFMQDSNPNSSMTNINITDNIFRYAGYGWGYKARPEHGYATDLKATGLSQGKYLNVKNNIFDRPRKGFTIFWKELIPQLYKFSGNTYVQYTNMQFASIDDDKKYSSKDVNELKNMLKSKFNETSPKIYLLPSTEKPKEK